MIYTLGESLMDIIFNDQQNIIANAGGGMLNTSISLSRVGIDVSLISELGDDQTALSIISVLEQNQVKTKYIKKYYQQNTSIALAYLDENKIPSFSIYKSYPFKRQLIKPLSYNDEDILVFGSLYSIDPAVRNDIKEITSFARKNNSIIIYDPNIRSHSLSDADLRTALFENIAYADIIKASDEDMRNIFGEMNNEEYFEEIKKINSKAVFVLTLGAEGVVGFTPSFTVKYPAKEVKVVSTIGAGDAFNAGIVYFLEKSGSKKNRHELLNENNFEKMLQMGLDFSAEVCGTLENYLVR